MKKLYIIAHTWKDTDMTIETFRIPADCTKKLGELVDEEFEQPDEGEDPEAYLDRYNDWRDENDVDEPDYYVTLEVVELPEYDMLREWYDWYNEWMKSETPTEVDEPSIEETARVLGIEHEV